MKIIVDGALIKSLREERGFTQEQLGALLGTGGNVVSRWERNRAKPNYTFIQKLSEVFGKPVDFFIKNGKNDVDIKERSITENKGMLVFEFNDKKLEVPATAEFSQQFWERVDRMIDMSIQGKLSKA